MAAVEAPTSEAEIRALARHISDLGGHSRARVFHLSWWSDRLLAASISDPDFRARLFRFVDAFPALVGDAEIEEHLRQEFVGLAVPGWFGAGLEIAEWGSLGARLSASVARRTIDRMARQFVIGTDAATTAAACGALWRRHTGATVDLLGEHTHSAAQADRYAERLGELVTALADAADRWPPDDLLEEDDLGPVPRASVSVKITALAPSFAPLTGSRGAAEVEARLVPILRVAAERGVSVWFDVERYEVKALTHQVYRSLAERPELSGLHSGIVIQGYLRDSSDDLASLARWASGRRTVPAVRLVKGAYWDTETMEAAAKGWPAPVFTRKAETDANYERLVGTLHDHHGVLRASFGTHNLRSLAVAVAAARARGIPDNGYELQLLYGMAEPIHDALRRLGARLRVYAPMGELVPGMAYLVRRLLENTSNDSFVRHHFAEGEALDELLAAPEVPSIPHPAGPARRRASRPQRPGPYRPEPPAEWHRHDVMDRFAEAVEREWALPTRRVPAVIGGDEVMTDERISSVDPADPTGVVAEVASCGAAEVGAAVSTVASGGARWTSVPMAERAGTLMRAADLLRRQRVELAAMEVHEAGKPWAEADADVCEAIDFLEFYARRALALAAGGSVQSPPGEDNLLRYRPRGVCAVIAPWNFPLAIPAGMTAAALVTGNAVVLKPAEQTPAIAARLVVALHDAGVPPDALAFVPGLGESAGVALVEDPRVDLISFTGSRAVGLGIVEAAARRNGARRSIVKVIAELGGKNAIVVDQDADLDEVVPAVAYSAFGFSGQKCSAASRLVAVGRIHDRLVEELVDATRALKVGPPRDRGTQVGPVVDADAHGRLLDVQARAGTCGDVVLARRDVPPGGFFVGPTVVRDVDPESWLARQEHFGPVLATFRAPTFDRALAMADDSEYALTAGVFSRSPANIATALARLRAGNVYVNRAITGAVVGRQPFGGRGLSGIGAKAGGPDTLLEYCDAQVVSENTVRQGFAPRGQSSPARAESDGE